MAAAGQRTVVQAFAKEGSDAVKAVVIAGGEGDLEDAA